MDFDRFAEHYREVLDRTVAISGEGSEYFAEYKARHVARLLPPGFSGKVLDFGCGVGLLSSFLKRHLPGCELHGFDISEASISKVDSGLLAQGQFTSRLRDLAYDYDVIVVANVMHHIALGDRQMIVHELSGRLCLGGMLTVFEHNPANPLTRCVVSQCPFDKDAILLRPSELLTYFAVANLRFISCDYIVFLPRVFSYLRALEPWFSWLPLGAQYAVVGEKNA